MNSILLPNNETPKFEPEKCFVTLDQIENLISEYEEKRDALQEKFESCNEVSEMHKIEDLRMRVSAKISVLKDIRHLAYVNGGYRN